MSRPTWQTGIGSHDIRCNNCGIWHHENESKCPECSWCEEDEDEEQEDEE